MMLQDSQLTPHDLVEQLQEIERIAGVGSWCHPTCDHGMLWSHQTHRLLGYEPGAIRPTARRFLQRLHREDRNRVVDAIRNSVRQGLSLMLVFRVQWPTGELHHLRVLGRRESEGMGVTRWIGTVQDITDSKRAEQERDLMFDQVCAGRERMQALSHRLLQVQEAERREIARDLHDELGQELTALRMALEAATDIVPRTGSPKPIRDSLSIVDRLLHHIRDLALDLRPSMLDDLGLQATLEWYVARQAERFGWTATCRIETLRTRPEEHVEAACFRVAQEALTNVARHAKATHISLTLRQTGINVMELAITDNGIGFDPAQARLKALTGRSVGLLGMEERARFAGGTMAITSHAGNGTTIVAQFPIGVGPLERRTKPR